MPTRGESAVLTVAALRSPKKGQQTRVLFNEREQIFSLASSTERQVSDLLRSARDKDAPVKVSLDPHRALIRKVAEPSRADLTKFEQSRIFLENPERPARFNSAKVDPTRFNVVDWGLKFKLFSLCTRIVPNYQKAKEIFDFCAQQSCHLPGPTAVTPCIPFQYVRDGCYARAHKMRKIIEGDYGYCCEKVFSFANQDYDELAVLAGKWGGCCVIWWYHVAPLIRVRVKILNFKFVLAMVVDPSMFDKPVLLSTWLTAQENKSCAPNARVSMYSIQAGSAYTPANYQGTQFSTDPSYTSTDSTLNSYKNLTTC